MDKNRAIGKGNDIPWYLPADLKYFKKNTSGHHIIMGRKCFNSIGKPLPNRTNIILTRDPFFVVTNCLIAHSIQEALQIAHDNNETEAFIIGGGMIYEQSLSLWDKMYITEVDLEVKDPEIFFPKLDYSKWSLSSEESHMKDERNAYDYTFKIYEKKQSA